jgi:alpha-beta hydrolase superfamily lysophospholipase
MRYLIFLFVFLFSTNMWAQVEEEWTLVADSIQIKGTLLLPAQDFTGPVVLFFSGSGLTDRNGNTGAQFSNNSLKMLAEGLAEKGLASFRFDKRSIPIMAMKRMDTDISFEDFIEDGKKWLERLKEDGRFDEYFVLGHSQGSTVGALVARDSAVAKLVSVAGPARPADQVILNQLKAQSPLMAAVAEPKLDSLKNGFLVTDPGPPLSSLFNRINQPFMISWFAYDPTEIISKLGKPVLVVNGTTDLQVKVMEAEALHASVPDAELLIIEGMNHVLKDAPKDQMQNLQTYSDPDKPLSDGLVAPISAFLLK